MSRTGKTKVVEFRYKATGYPQSYARKCDIETTLIHRKCDIETTFLPEVRYRDHVNTILKTQKCDIETTSIRYRDHISPVD